MKKYFNIWRNNYNSYLALFSYDNKKTTSVEHYEYIGTVVSESPKKAIDKFYTDNKNIITLDKSWLKNSDNLKYDILIWAKQLRSEYPSCPINTAINLGKIFFETEKGNTFRFNEIDFPDIDFSWIKKEDKKSKLEYKSCLFYDFIDEPWIPGLPPMFGEDVAFDRFEEKTTDIIASILDFVKAEDKSIVYNLTKELISATENRQNVPDEILDYFNIKNK